MALSVKERIALWEQKPVPIRKVPPALKRVLWRMGRLEALQDRIFDVYEAKIKKGEKAYDALLFVHMMDTLMHEGKILILEKKIDLINERYHCPVCKEGIITKFLLPCGHCVCDVCESSLSTCPLCREDIKLFYRLFIPAQ